jgi:hypothetical protein
MSAVTWAKPQQFLEFLHEIGSEYFGTVLCYVKFVGLAKIRFSNVLYYY